MSSRKLDSLDLEIDLEALCDKHYSQGRSRGRGRNPRPYNPTKDHKALKGNLEEAIASFKPWTSHDVFELAREIFKELGSPLALRCEAMIEKGELVDLMQIKIDPRKYSSPDEYLIDAQVVSLLRKLECKIPGLDPKKEALAKFLEAEDQCSQANVRIRASRSSSFEGPCFSDVFHVAREFVISVIGLEPNPEEWLSRSRFGPGSTTANSGVAITEYDKLLTTPDSTHEVEWVARAVIASSPCWTESREADPSGHLLGLVPGNEYFSVPKNAQTERPCCKEPTMNAFLQAGLGGIIRKRLKKVGIDLDDQMPNQRLAYSGSLFDDLATIDLSSASDTMCRELVQDLLPPLWYRYLDLVRSKVGYVDGKYHHYAKFSSMGNGFTFELESLIFASLCVGVAARHGVDLFPRLNFCVYGDDIIVPSVVAPTLIEALSFAGFLPNVNKTFVSGPFRESCGKDYYRGELVRPLFLTKVPTDVGDVFAMANGFTKMAHDLRDRGPISGLFGRLALLVEKRLPKLLRRIRIPRGAPEDGGLIGPRDPSTSGQLSCGWEGFWFYRLRRVPVKRYWKDPSASKAAMLYRIRNPWVPIPLEVRVPSEAGFSFTRFQEGITLVPMTVGSWGESNS